MVQSLLWPNFLQIDGIEAPGGGAVGAYSWILKNGRQHFGGLDGINPKLGKSVRISALQQEFPSVFTCLGVGPVIGCICLQTGDKETAS